MSRIKNKNTKPEVLVRKKLFSYGFRYRINVTKLPGKPDIVLPKYKTVILVNGCFWHGHNKCKYFILPKTRTEWWSNKINTNIERDNRILEELLKLGWNVLVIWECELKKSKLEITINKLIEEIRGNLPADI